MGTKEKTNNLSFHFLFYSQIHFQLYIARVVILFFSLGENDGKFNVKVKA